MLRKVVLGSGLAALVPAVRAATPVEAPSGPARPPPMCVSELPIYEAPHADYREYIDTKSTDDQTSYIRSALREPVSVVREQVQTVWERTDSVKNTVRDNFNELTDRTDWIVKYLREEDNKEVRYGAVVMGGLAGFIFGLRGGIVRRLVYSSAGVAALGAVCFPDEARELARANSALAGQYVNIAYNFLYGVKPGDPQLELKLPELSFPKNFSEFVDLSVSVASTVKQAVLPPPAKEEAASKPEKKD